MTHYKNFLIDHIDSLGQGVFKQDDQVYFIPKTLPDEEGTFEIKNSSKGVNFGQVKQILKSSESRIQSECPHYNECSGCSFLHTHYENEVDIKTKNLQRMMSFLDICENDTPIKYIKNNQRFFYRNRVQLHYDKKNKLFGFKRAKSKLIHSINNCLLATMPIQEKLLELTHENNWLKIIPKKAPIQGHLELSLKNDHVQIYWNKAYAEGGFTQVNTAVNELLLKELSEIYKDSPGNVLDLFGGNGNLSSQVPFKKRLVADIYKNAKDDFFNIDLFRSDALDLFSKKIDFKVDTLLVDPPRSGFREFSSWSEKLKPSSIFYLSCNPHTLFRDLKGLKDYKVVQFFLIEFFPSTHHFEVAVQLERL